MQVRILLAAILLAFPGMASSEDDARNAAQKTVRLFERTGAQWQAQCLSCHNQALPMMALAAARSRGLAVDETAAKNHAAKVFAPLWGSIDRPVQGVGIIDPGVSDSYALIAAEACGIRNTSTEATALRVARWQLADGHWSTFDGRPPSSISLFSATALSVRALSLHLPEELRQEREERTARARKWLLSNEPRLTEDHVFQLFGVAWSGGSGEERHPLVASLVKRQNDDGGWGQLPGLASDAYSTAQVLAALAQAGQVPVSHAAWQRGLTWLLRAQQADGSWHVRTWINTPANISPKYLESGFPYGKDQFISAAASAWAVIAISESLPRSANPARPLAVPEASPVDEPSWTRTALFGSASDLRRLLDGGLDANTSTKDGTSLLMMASGDLDKVRLLLARGARVDHRARNGYTVPLVSVGLRGGAPVLKALLDGGATVKPLKGVRNNGSPLVMAALAGDEPASALLIENGASVTRPMLLLGTFPATPLAVAAGSEHEAVMRLLVKHGADVDETDANGMTALGFALLSHKLTAAKVLLELGAKPGHLDKLGWTAAQHSLGIQYPPEAILALVGNQTRPAVKQKAD